MSQKIGNDNEYPLSREDAEERQLTIFLQWRDNKEANKIVFSTSMSHSEKIAALQKLIFVNPEDLDKGAPEILE